MKQLNFINGQLLAAVLAGAAIMAAEYDGCDFHVVVRTPKKKKEDVSLFVRYSTDNYANKNNTFLIGESFDDKITQRDAVSKFSVLVKAEADFKAKYPRPENLPAEEAAEETTEA